MNLVLENWRAASVSNPYQTNPAAGVHPMTTLFSPIISRYCPYKNKRKTDEGRCTIRIFINCQDLLYIKIWLINKGGVEGARSTHMDTKCIHFSLNTETDKTILATYVHFTTPTLTGDQYKTKFLVM